VWSLLTLRDNWQGEFCVALFGAVGWAAVGAFSADSPPNLPQYSLLDQIAPPLVWQVWFFVFGVVQLWGLRTTDRRGTVARAIGATGVFVGLMSVFLTVLLTAPWATSLAPYFACLCIEFCAIIFHTGTVIRNAERRNWPSTGNP